MLRPYLVLSDHLGSTSTTANEDGSWNSTIQYTAFGEIRLTKNTTPTKYRYTGQLAQAELGLDYYVARFYDPLTGHFTQADSIIPEPGKASAFDRYAYVLNNPIRYSDPSGHGIDSGIGDSGYDRSGDLKRWRGYTQQKNKKRLSQTPTTLPVPTPFFSRTSTPIPLPMSTPTPYPRSTTGTAFTATTTPTASLTIDMDELQIQFWFHKYIVKDTLDIIEIMDILFEKSNKISNLKEYKLTKGISSSGVYEAIIAMGSEGYEMKNRPDIHLGKKVPRILFMGAEAYITDSISTIFGSIVAIPSVAMLPEAPVVGAAIGYGVGATSSSVIIENGLDTHINPWLFPIIGLGEY